MNRLRPILLLAGLAIVATPALAAAAPTAPVVGALPAVTNAPSVNVTWSASTFDALSSAQAYTVSVSSVVGAIETPVSSSAIAAPASQVTVALPANNTTYRIRVSASQTPCLTPALDGLTCEVPNVITEATTSNAVDVRTDRSGPAVTMSLAGGAAWTSDETIRTGLSASDGSGLRMILGNTPPAACVTPATCGVPYEANALYTLPAGDGAKTVYARIVDAAGNQTLVSDGIGLDTSTPDLWATADDLTVDTGTTVQFSTRSATDTGSGLDEATFTWTFCKTCAAGAAGRTATRTFPTAGQFEITLRARDLAGNVGSDSFIVTVTAPDPATGGGTTGGGTTAGGGTAAGGRVTLTSARLEGVAKVGAPLKVRVKLKKTAKVTVDIRSLPVRGRTTLLKRFRSKVALTPGTKILRLAVPTKAATRTITVTAGGEKTSFRVRIRPA